MVVMTHRDIAAADMEWRDGSGAGIKFASFRTDESRADSPYIVISEFAAGTIVQPHTHDSNYFEYVIAGEQIVGKTRFGPGDVRLVQGGTGYGPIHVGPEGCRVLIVFENALGAATETLPRKKKALAGGPVSAQ